MKVLSIMQNTYMDHAKGILFIIGCAAFALVASAAAVAFAAFLPVECNIAFCI
jgi:hypothetical protein